MSLAADLRGKVALVTGASGGLGAHFATLLASHGAAVVPTARRLPELVRLADAITGAGGRALPLMLDVTDADRVRRVFAEAEAAFGPVDILVNNAGITGPTRPMLEVEQAGFAEVMRVDLEGAWLVAGEAARRLVAAGRPGSIVNIASILGLGVTGGVAPYVTAKAALIQLTRAMALEWARHRIRVNALAPGYIMTDINRAFLESPAGQALVRRIPQRRLGRPEDLDGPLLLLASDASAYMTGSVLVADGGHLNSSL